MSTWLEIRCEDRHEEWSDTSKWRDDGPGRHRCMSHDNTGPMQMAGDTADSVRRAYADLRVEAQSSGWVRMAHGWVCPYCVAHRPGGAQEPAAQ